MARRYHRTEKSGHAEQVAKKARSEYGNEKGGKGKSNPDIAAAFERFCREISEYLSVEQMRQILEANGQQWKDSDQDAVVPKCLDMVYYGPLDNCPICGGNLECGRSEYYCTSAYSEWSTCTFTTRDPPRREEPLVLPDFIKETPVYNEHQDPKSRSKREQFGPGDKPFTGMTISLCGRLSRTQQRWKSNIEEHGGEVTNSVPGITCLVVPPSESQRGRSSKVAEAMKHGIPVVTENWLIDTLEKQETLPLDSYVIPGNPQDTKDKALELMAAEIKIFGKRGVHKDTKLEELGGKIFEKDGILYNCVFSLSDRGKKLNEFCVMQLIVVPEKHLHLYCKRGNLGDDSRAEILLVEWENVDDAIAYFGRLFKELTGNDFEPWEREKKFEKKLHKFFPIDMADGHDIR